MPLIAVLLAVAALTVVMVGRLVMRATADAQAGIAADAAALAGVVEGEDAARALAEANGAELRSFERDGNQVQVSVGLGDLVASARAEYRAAVTGGAGRSGLAPGLLAALDRADALLGRPVPIVSGWRSRAQQEALWARRDTNPYPVARPGTSRHEKGLAIDVPRGVVVSLRSVAGAAGLCFPLPESDPVHFELCRWNRPS